MLKQLINDYKRTRKLDVMFYIFLYRLGNKIYYSNLPKLVKRILIVLLKIPQKLLNISYGSEFPFPAKIGGGLKILHLNGIIIHQNATIGNECTIYHQTTIGANESRKRWDLVATIGDRVYIGAGAKVIGNVTIGSDVTIGANSVIVKDVQNNCVVVGNPAKVIKINGVKVNDRIS
jgi:serine O-acetyltransferase